MAVSDQEIRDFFAANPDATAEQVYQGMVQYNVSPEQLSRATGIDINRVRQEYVNQAVAQSPNNIPDEAIRAYFAANPNIDPSVLRATMDEYGVTPQQFARAIGQTYQAATANNLPAGQVGFEQATQTGLDDVIKTLRGAQSESMGYLDPAMAEVARLYNLNIAGLGQAGTQARGDIERTFGAAGEMFQPYQQAGTTALQQELALSGALGQDAFNQAYQESPYVRFLREQGERSTIAGAAATGGLGGGRVQQELVRFGQGLAGQGLQQQIQNLRALSGQGLQATGAGADIQTAMGTNLASLGMNTAQNIAAQRGALAGERSQYGTNLANLAASTGANIANAQGIAAQNVAQQRARAGELLASQIGGATAGLQNYALGQSNALANLLSGYGEAGLNLGQTYTADQIAAMQNAANQQAISEESYAGLQSNLLADQPFYQQPFYPQQPQNYGQMIGNALDAAALGYEFGNNIQRGQPSSAPNTVGPLRQGYVLPTNQVNTGVPFNPAFPALNSSNLSSVLGGTYRSYGG